MIANVEPTQTERGRRLSALRALQIATIAVNGARVSGASAKAVLRTIDDHGEACWASIETIARETCLDPRTTRRCIQGLASEGLITVTDKPGATKTIVVNWQVVESRITPDTMSPRTSCPPGHDDLPPPDTMSPHPGHNARGVRSS